MKDQLNIFSSFAEEATTKKNPGPPNRMNDMPYKEWMKFQKSFYWHATIPALATEHILFFTKAVWPGGEISVSLVVGTDVDCSLLGPRCVVVHPDCKGIESILDHLEQKYGQGVRFDYIFVNLAELIPSDDELVVFLEQYAERLSSVLRKLLHHQKYCTILVQNYGGQGGAGFPAAWAVASACRRHLRLRDEKIGLVLETGQLFYNLIMQCEDDGRRPGDLSPMKLNVAHTTVRVPAWTIPKPPRRKANEILHPAKYPETLVSEFIQMFTEEGDHIFDPMVGTGSTVVAALRNHRNGYGVDLSPEFAAIAQQRVKGELQPTILADEVQRGLIVLGDSTKLGDIRELAEVVFDYCVTSPPYWSMLGNKGSENQRARREKSLRLTYSEDDNDLGNVEDYDTFLDLLETVYRQVAERLSSGGVLTVVVKNVKRDHVVYPLAWDLVMRLCGQGEPYEYVGNTFWCQDDIGLKPFAVGIHWVSNTLHQYCIHMRKRT